MIKFMVIGSPRSGTAWAANWLTTDNTRCLHDPLFRYHYDQLDKIRSEKDLGVSCTGLAMFPAFVNAHPANKIVLHRPIKEVDASLAKLGLPPLDPGWPEALGRIRGMHCPWDSLFDPKSARIIYETLLDRMFDPERHAELVDLNVQMNFGTVHVNAYETNRLFQELRRVGDSLR